MSVADGVLQRFPDPAPLRDMLGTARTLVEPVGQLFTAFGADQPDSPMRPLVTAFGALEVQANVDVSGLSTRLPDALRTISEALPSSALEYVESIQEAYATARSLLEGSSLLRDLPTGKLPRDVALALLEDAAKLLQDRVEALAGQLIPQETIQRITSVLTELDQLLSDFPAHQGQLGPFLARNLVGVAPDVLGPALAHIQASFTVVASLDPDALATALGGRRQALAGAWSALSGAVAALDPDDPQGYVTVEQYLAAVEQAASALFGALEPLYQQLQGLVAAHPWETVAAQYRSLLQAIPPISVATLDDVVRSAVEAIDALGEGLDRYASAEDLKARIDAVAQALRTTALQTALGQVRASVLDFVHRVRDAIEALPTGEIEAAVEQMLQRVRQELDALGVEDVAAGVEEGFEQLEEFITSSIQGVGVELPDVVNGALAQVKATVSQLLGQLTSALQTVSGLITEAEQAVQARLDELNGFLARLEEVSFEPVSEAVIAEIDALRDRLRAIHPDALSDAEKLAIRAALATLEALDLEGQVIAGLKQGFATAQGGVKSLLDEISAAVERLRDNLGDFQPEALLGPLGEILGRISGAVERLNGRELIQPLRQQADALNAALAKLSPGALLEPLKAPYQAFLGQVARLDPAQWLAPLEELYARIDALIDQVDITPLFDELAQREQALLATLRSALLSAFDALSLPEPLKSFLASLRPAVEGVTGALLSEPDSELKRLAGDFRQRFHAGDVFAPLDQVFDKLVAMLQGAPQDAVTSAVNGLRQGLGLALDALDPWAVRSRLLGALHRLEAISPRPLLAPLGDLARLRLAFQAKASVALPDRAGDIARVDARFGAVIALVDPERVDGAVRHLLQLHEATFAALQRGVYAVDLSGAASAYARVRDDLDRRLPDFLRRTEALTHADIMAGIGGLRPSVRGAPIQQAMERFLQKLQPVLAVLADSVDGLFSAFRELLRLVDPRALKDDVREVYEAVHAKVRVLDPEVVAEAIRTNVLDPLKAPLQAIDPAKLQARLDVAYGKARDAMAAQLDAVLDSAEQALEQYLASIRVELQALLKQVEEVAETATGSVEAIIRRVEQLVLVEILERLKRVADKLKLSFDQELDRVRSSFDAMLQAIPLGGGTAQAAAAVGG